MLSLDVLSHEATRRPVKWSSAASAFPGEESLATGAPFMLPVRPQRYRLLFKMVHVVNFPLMC